MQPPAWRWLAQYFEKMLHGVAKLGDGQNLRARERLNRKTEKAILCGGDVGWNTDMDVIGGLIDDLRLGKVERAWLQACWLAGTKTRK